MHQSPQTPMPRLASQMCDLTQRLEGLRVVPAVRADVGRLGADAGDLGEGLEQLGLHALGVVVAGAPATRRRWPARSSARRGRARLARLARQPGNAVMRAARGVPLRPQRRQAGLHGLRKGHHQRPAGRDLHLGRSARAIAGACCEVCSSTRACSLGMASSTASKPECTCAAPSDPLGVQLPAMRVERVAFDASPRASPVPRHCRPAAVAPSGCTRHSCPAWRPSAARATGSGGRHHPTQRVEHAHGVGAPGPAQAGHGVQCAGKERVAHREVLRAVVEACRTRSRGWPCGRPRRGSSRTA